MSWLRLISPRYVLALEKQRRADKRAIDSLVNSIGRQAPAGSETELRAELVLLTGRVHTLEAAAGMAMRYFDDGRYQSARRVLAMVLNAEPVNQREAG